MFKVFSDDERRAARGGKAPLLISTTVHLFVVVVLLIAPLVYVSTELPLVPDMLTFVVSAAPAPPPPAPAPPASKSAIPTAKSAPSTRAHAAPVEAPAVIEKEAVVDIGSDDGMLGGVEGGVAGGVAGGIVGGLVTAGLPPPPPPPLPPAPPAPPVERAPVRIGGEVTAPALLERVEPTYPPLAVRAKVTGLVILEAVVDRDGRVEDVRVLRSAPFLDAAAVEAVSKWRYSPLLLNGKPERFVLTVTLSFSLPT
jgi:protein TonB